MTQEDKGREGVWGPEIRVDGVRPKWLMDDDLTTARSRTYHRHNGKWPDPALNWKRAADVEGWEHITHLRLPSDHPHYAAQQPRTAPSGGEVGAEVHDLHEARKHDAMVWDRMEALVRSMSLSNGPDSVALPHYFREARAIVALLPAEVDPDLLEARQICQAAIGPDLNVLRSTSAYLTGEMDKSLSMRCVLAALKTRSLASGEG